MSFSPEWLALREPIDHRSRDPGVARRLQDRFAGRERIDVVDLGCGTGSNLRGSYRLLPAEQRWTLVDYDPLLLAAAREALAAWSDRGSATVADDGSLLIGKDRHRLEITFRQANLHVDLDAALDAALGAAPDLVTASAFFDLCSTEFIDRLVAAVATRGAAFFTVLTFDGRQEWAPRHAADDRLLAAFVAHQGGDKGFGPSAGPTAAKVLDAAFRRAGYSVHEGDSPWHLGPDDGRLLSALVAGFAAAVAETGVVDGRTLDDWRVLARTHGVVGHTDTLALPPLPG